MVLPLSSPHPVGIENPVTIRAAAALPAAGVWDAAPTEIDCAGLRYVTFYLTYTRGGAGGAVDFQPEYSPYAADVVGVESWFPTTARQVGAVVAGIDTQNLTQVAYDTFTSQGAAAEPFVHGPIDLGHTVQRLRFPARESGAGLTPGTLHIVAIFNLGA